MTLAPTERSDTALDALQQALLQKTALIHEVDHRVKNNLQLITSLFQIQARRSDPATRDVICSMLARINAIAVVHRRLFRSEDVERFDVAAFISDLASEIASAEAREDVALHLDLVRIDIAARNAAPLALVISELLTNAYRHAFPAGRGGAIRVLTRTDGPKACIQMTDDGIGMLRDNRSGFGFTIVNMLCRQLGGQLERLEQSTGTGFVISLETG